MKRKHGHNGSRRWRILQDLLDLHSGERNAIVVLFLFLLGAMAYVVHQQWFAPRKVPDLVVYEQKLEEWRTDREARKTGPVARAGKPVVDSLFPFDPNGLSAEDWVRLGLTSRQAEAVHRYEEAGGRFRTKKDVARLFVVDEELYEAWEPFIQLPDRTERRSRPPAKAERATRSKAPEVPVAPATAAVAPASAGPLEVNAADSAALVALRGIGPSFARGILGYRNMLGGYVSIEQLSEVYVLRDKPDALARVRELLVVDPTLVRRIDVNTASVDELAAHPYVDRNLAKVLVAYREQHGPYANVEAVQQCRLIDPPLFRKLAPYFTVK